MFNQLDKTIVVQIALLANPSAKLHNVLSTLQRPAVSLILSVCSVQTGVCTVATEGGKIYSNVEKRISYGPGPLNA